jgi:hypothetical protein
MQTKNRKDDNRIVVITRKEAERYFMSTIERPPTPEDIMIRSEEDTRNSGKTKKGGD